MHQIVEIDSKLLCTRIVWETNGYPEGNDGLICLGFWSGLDVKNGIIGRLVVQCFISRLLNRTEKWFKLSLSLAQYLERCVLLKRSIILRILLTYTKTFGSINRRFCLASNVDENGMGGLPLIADDELNENDGSGELMMEK